MSSSVFYKFKSQKGESRITFDGTGISVFDLKKEIILASGLGKATDFDLCIYDNVTEQEYKDDNHIIPRSSSVIVKRLPPSRPGKGKAAMYVAGVSSASGDAAKDKPLAGAPSTFKAAPGVMSKRFDGKEDHAKPKPLGLVSTVTTSPSVAADEAASIAAMFQASSAQWEETQEKMSQAQRIFTQPRGGGHSGPRKPFFQQQQQHSHPHSDRPPPAGYVCYRCSQKGHWIQDCPTNNDREYDNRPRIKRTTGIPRSMLKSVEQPSEGIPGQGVMVTPDGGYVIAQPDSAAWQKQRAKPKAITEADVREKAPTDASLACPSCSKLFREAVKTPCCSTTYCEECIQTHLLEHDFACPSCNRKIASLDKLIPDKAIRARTREYIDEKIEESKRVDDPTPSTTVSGTATPSGSTGADTADQEVSFDQQPGGSNDMNNQMMDFTGANIPQIQAQLQQLTQMLQNPSLPPQARMQVQLQVQALSTQLQQAQMLASFGMAMNNASVADDSYNFRGYKKGEYRPTWTNPFPNQQPAGQESAYQRLPVNNRRRGPKRDRPSDFIEMGEQRDGQSKAPRMYWE